MTEDISQDTTAGLVVAPKTDKSVKVFIGQIPKSFTEPDLLQIIQETGANVNELTVLKDRTTGVSRGCGFVTVADKQNADRVINTLNNVKILPGMGRPMQLKIADSELERFVSKLFVGMLSKTATDDDLRALFSQFGQVEDVTILRQMGQSKGCGFVRFAERSSAEHAINALNGIYKMDGSPQALVVKFADTDKARELKQQQKFVGHQSQAQYYQAPPLQPYQQVYQQPSPMYRPQVYQPQVPLQTQPQAQPTSSGPYAQPVQMGLSYPQSPYFQPGVSGGYQQPMILPQGQTRAMQGAGSRSEGPPGANLFIYHLPQEVRDVELAGLFAGFGNVISAKVFIDRQTNLSKCFGFVSFDNPSSGAIAIQNMNGYQIGGKRLKVQEKRAGDSGPKPY